MSFSIGLAEHGARSNTLKVGVPSGGIPSQPQALVQAPAERLGGMRLTNQGSVALTYQVCGQGKLRAIAGEALAGAGVTSVQGLFVNKQIVPGTVIVQEVAAVPETFTDNGDGTLTGDQGGSGTVDYKNGTYAVTFAAISTGAVTAGYDTVGWQRYSTTANLAAGGGGAYRELEPLLGDSWQDFIKGHTYVGIEAYTPAGGDATQLEVQAFFFGESTYTKLDLPPELKWNLNDIPGA